MSQIENAVTSSSKRIYRKGNPLSSAEKKRLSISRKRRRIKSSMFSYKTYIKKACSSFVKRLELLRLK